MNNDENSINLDVVEFGDGKHAVCMNPENQQYGWIYYKHADGHWVTLRRALPQEIERALNHIKMMKELFGIPCRA